MNKEDLKDIPVEIVLPILEAAPFVYGLVLDFIDMVNRTRSDIASWGEKSEEERRQALEEAGKRFDDSMSRFKAAAAEVQAKSA